MRKFIVAILALSTVLLHAQTATKGQSAVQQARSEAGSAMPAAAAAQPLTDMDVNSQPRRISTGVIGPKLLGGPKIVVSSSDFYTSDVSIEKAVVRFKVDEQGMPHNVQLIKSVNPVVDARVLAAVREYRFAPATLDEQPVPINLDLAIRFQEQK